jgi:hypothetical protein
MVADATRCEIAGQFASPLRIGKISAREIETASDILMEDVDLPAELDA